MNDIPLNRSGVARLLGITRMTLYRLEKEYGTVRGYGKGSHLSGCTAWCVAEWVKAHSIGRFHCIDTTRLPKV